jgi:hypothetical protein
MIIFKGKHDGRIAQSEFATYPAGHHHRRQDAAWMDKHVMLAWVEEVLAPYVATAPDDIIPLRIFGQLPMPYDGISCLQDPVVGWQGEAHSWRMHFPLSAG